MAAELGMDIDDFMSTWARRLHDGWSLKERLTSHGWDCVFLDGEKVPGKAVCRLYGSRPKQCRTWPFWPESRITRSLGGRPPRYPVSAWARAP